MPDHDAQVMPFADVTDRWVLRCGCGLLAEYATRDKAERGPLRPPHGRSADVTTESEVDETEIRRHNGRTAKRVAARCSFQLHYSRANYVRTITPEYLHGEPIDDAATPGKQSTGTWSAGDHPGWQFHRSQVRRVPEQEWLNHYASMAVNEAVHEALEWFQVDGEPWLDPHDPDVEAAIYDEVAALAARLAAIRAGIIAERAGHT